MAKQTYKIHIPSTYLEKEEIWAIIHAIPRVSLHPERDSLFLRVMWETGGRVSEVNHLIPDQIEEKALSINLINLKQHTKEPAYKKVWVPKTLVDSLLAYISAHKIGPTSWVFSGNRNPAKPLSRNYVWWIVKKAANVAGVRKFAPRKGRKIPAWPHLFRHACAMHILDRLGSTEKAQRQLGHSSLITTQVYATLKLQESDKDISEMDWE